MGKYILKLPKCQVVKKYNKKKIEHELDQDILQKYNYKKLKNEELLNYIVKHVSDSSKDRINMCGSFLQFVADKKFKKIKLNNANFCENRFCPMCAWRQAKKDALKISICMKYIEVEHKKDFIFLTLTAPNVKGDKLKAEIGKYNKAFKKMFERKEFESINKGYVRKLEVTYDDDAIISYEMWHGSERYKPRYEYYERLGLKIGDENPSYDTYHTHFHVIIAVNKSYFTDKTYIKHSEWLNTWREVMDDQSITQIDVRKIKKDKKNGDVLEIAKYSAKDSDMFISQEVFDVFYNALKRRQLITYNGLFKIAVDLFKKGELDKYKEIDQTEYVYFMLYNWGFGEYVQAELRELTEEERKKINKHLIDESEVKD